MTNDITDTLPSPLWRRLLALLYDVMAVIAIAAVTGLICQIATHGQLFDPHGHALTWWFQPLQYLVISAYFAGSWLRGGQTLGMRPWRIRLRSANGAPVTGRQAAVRLIVAWLPVFALELQGWIGTQMAVYISLGCWTAWFAVALVDARKRALHDIIAGTELRRIPA